MKQIKMIFALLIGFAAVISGQEKLRLTVDEAVNVGLKNSRNLHVSQLKVTASEAKVKEANASQWFNVKLVAAYRRLSPVDPFAFSMPGVGTIEISPSILDNYTTQLTLTQPLFTGFKISSGIDIAEYSSGAVKEDYNKDRSDLIYNIKNAYWNLYKAEMMKKVIDENVDQIKAHLADAKNLFKAGMLTNNDVLKLEVQLSDVMLKQVDAGNGVQLAMIALNNVLSIPLSTEIDIASEATMVPADFQPLNDLTSTALEARPELKAMDQRIKVGEAGVKMAQSNWYPQVALVGDYIYSRPNQRIFPTKDEFKGTWDFGVNLSLNIWDWLTTAHQTAQAEASLAQAIDSKQVIKDGITLEVTQSYLNLNVAKQKISITDLAVQQAAENNRILSEKFKAGMALSSDVIDAEVALLAAKTNHTSSIVDYELAKAKLEKSIGK